MWVCQTQVWGLRRFISFHLESIEVQLWMDPRGKNNDLNLREK